MSSDEIIEANKDMLTADFPITLVCAKMTEFENNKVIPYYIYRVYEV